MISYTKTENDQFSIKIWLFIRPVVIQKTALTLPPTWPIP